MKSSTRTQPFSTGAPDASAPDETPLWQRVAAQLPEKDESSEWYSTRDIAPLLGIKPKSLTKHCRDLWPKWEGQYRFDLEQATRLIRRVCYAGRKVPLAQVEPKPKPKRGAK